jgi:hypothetical protein
MTFTRLARLKLLTHWRIRLRMLPCGHVVVGSPYNNLELKLNDFMENPDFILSGKKVAILVADGFEKVELTEPRDALEDAGAETEVVSPCDHKVKAAKHGKPSGSVKVDVPLNEANAESYDALLLPGGVMNPDTLRMDHRAIEFVKSFFEAGKPVAAICHGPWTLVEPMSFAVAGSQVIRPSKQTFATPEPIG